MIKKIFICLLIIFILVAFYLNSYYHADKVDKYLSSNNDIKVNKIDNYYYFDGPGSDKMVIFYPGGKVENISYAPILYNLSLKGIDCVLLKMPFNLAIFDINAADKVFEKYKYSEYYLMGHSLGGVVSAMYASKTTYDIDGIIFLASYPTSKINTRMLSIYGSNDGVLNMDKYKDSKKYFDNFSQEYIIKGGNHAGFGNYGSQNKDKKATISRSKQQQITINEIIKFVNS